jgi:hypothetical protein
MTSRKHQLDRLHDRISDLINRIDPVRTVRITVWKGETEESARARHLAEHPADASPNVEFQISHLRWMTPEEAALRGWD